MKIKRTWVWMVLLLAGGFVSNLWAFEIITADDIKQKVIVSQDLIKTADNAIFLFDSSSSMNKPYKDTGMTRYEVAKKILMERNSYFPDLGHTFGFYLYTPWKEIYPVQKYDREKFASSLETLPQKATTATFLTDGLKRLDGVLKKLEGKTAVFLFTDGSDTNQGAEKKKPVAYARELAKKYDVCFYIITTADDFYSSDLLTRASELNFCSRVIAFDDFIHRSGYNSEALFTVKATRKIVTITDKRIVGIKTNNFIFDFDKTDLSADARKRLSILAAFLKENPTTFAALAGHTDNTGTEDYNLGLSCTKRAESIARYLVDNLQVDASQLLLFWFGQLNPVADNETIEGRRQNRRVEVLVGGI